MELEEIKNLVKKYCNKYSKDINVSHEKMSILSEPTFDYIFYRITYKDNYKKSYLIRPHAEEKDAIQAIENFKEQNFKEEEVKEYENLRIKILKPLYGMEHD